MVSIIIPSYKRSDRIERAINSILQQTYSDYEIIVVDDNNPDTEYRKVLAEKMKHYQDNPKVKYVQHEKNKNGAAARNTGISIAQGEYIAFLDDDDYYFPNRLQELVNALEQNKKYNAAYSTTIVTRKGKVIGRVDAVGSGNWKKELLLQQFSLGTGSNLFFRAETLKKINGFDEKFQRHQDIEVMVRFFRENELLAINKPLVVKVQDDRSNEPKVDRYLQVKEVYYSTFKQDLEHFTKQEQNLFYAQNYSNVYNAAIKNKEYSRCKGLRQKIETYQKWTIKNRVQAFLLFLNNYIRIENVKYLFKRIKVSSQINQEEKQYIKQMEKNGR